MNKIYSWAIQNAQKINQDLLSHLVNQMDDEMAERFVSALLGITDISTIYGSIPITAPNTETERNRRFEHYNYLQDLVTVSYESKYTRYFPTREEAEAWENNSEIVYAGRYDKNESNPYPGVRWSKTTKTYSLSNWIDLCNKK